MNNLIGILVLSVGTTIAWLLPGFYGSKIEFWSQIVHNVIIGVSAIAASKIWDWN